MFRAVPESEVAAFRWFVHCTPTHELPSPHKVTHAFDEKPPWLKEHKMTKLIDALKAKYRTPEAAMRALGLDVALLKSAVTGDAMPRRLSRRTRMVRDAEQNKQFEQEQFAGEDEDDDATGETIVKIQNLLKGKVDTSTLQQVLMLLDGGEMSCDADDRLARLRDYLKKNGTLSEAEISEALEIARNSMGEDEPAPFSGRPNPGGWHDPTTSASRSIEANRTGATDSRMIFKQNGVINSRNIAYALASCMQRDNSVPVQHFGAPTPTQSKQARKQLANDAARSNSSATLVDTYSRFPMLARIGRA